MQIFCYTSTLFIGNFSSGLYSEHGMRPEELRKEQGNEFRQITPPDHPRVPARRLNVSVTHSLGGEPGAEFPVQVDEMVIGTASNPEHAHLLIGFRVEPRKRRIE